MNHIDYIFAILYDQLALWESLFTNFYDDFWECTILKLKKSNKKINKFAKRDFKPTENKILTIISLSMLLIVGQVNSTETLVYPIGIHLV